MRVFYPCIHTDFTCTALSDKGWFVTVLVIHAHGADGEGRAVTFPTRRARRPAWLPSSPRPRSLEPGRSAPKFSRVSTSRIKAGGAGSCPGTGGPRGADADARPVHLTLLGRL